MAEKLEISADAKSQMDKRKKTAFLVKGQKIGQIKLLHDMPSAFRENSKNIQIWGEEGFRFDHAFT